MFATIDAMLMSFTITISSFCCRTMHYMLGRIFHASPREFAIHPGRAGESRAPLANRDLSRCLPGSARTPQPVDRDRPRPLLSSFDVRYFCAHFWTGHSSPPFSSHQCRLPKPRSSGLVRRARRALLHQRDAASFAAVRHCFKTRASVYCAIIRAVV